MGGAAAPRIDLTRAHASGTSGDSVEGWIDDVPLFE
jgi:hypothetical protein